ncbi:MAG: YhfC family intramembrane metalloprotease [Ardenticatenaceae bacterium]|nr:YhfC family intramembrane metalloprotease [Anaerolineales bacterium]MCB8922797.1 YhfC family intramembrane metalloprotease [Ardenticatenaceae bacterium]MCB8991930.1 YhfC family intramembrane metalloprotease [Ardenticatenaceae bacterium]MCB9004740.1 YhfC family intramembrane metalloprotease [Ardenticatenaceae bacterium]
MTLYILSISLMLLLPLTAVIWLRRRFVVPWWLFLVGAATFAASQAYHLPLNNWLTSLGIIGPVNSGDPDFWRTAVILGLSAGLCETAARAVGYWLLFRKGAAQRREDALMVGLGHGGIEAMGLIATLTAAQLSALWAMRGTDLTTLNLPAEQLTFLSGQLQTLGHITWQPFAGLLERVLAVILHVILSLLVWQAFRQRNLLYGLAALLYHALFDFTAVYLSQTLSQVGWLYLVFLALLLPGGVWLWRMWPVNGERPSTQPISTELRLFGAALRKEMQQQWRTRRVLVVLAVFTIFGLGSPLLAKFTPQMLTMIEGAEQFADLIPEPTRVDAMTQYIKNITQFGFIIAVLLGMGAVAGEKDKGQAALILSKPLPRWAFLLSKFMAQGLLYAAAFFIAALGAYYYTTILFEPFQFGAFMAGNGLLLLWLLTFTAVTLLASTLANNIGTGAGIALLGAVMLLLAGSIPQIAPFAPGSLVAWASQLGLETAVPFQGGSLVANAMLIILLLISSLAAFETQEL